MRCYRGLFSPHYREVNSEVLLGVFQPSLSEGEVNREVLQRAFQSS